LGRVAWREWSGNHLVFSLDEAACVMVRRDVPKDDIVRKVPEKRNAGIDEYRDPRDGQPLDESFAEELLDGVSPST